MDSSNGSTGSAFAAGVAVFDSEALSSAFAGVPDSSKPETLISLLVEANLMSCFFKKESLAVTVNVTVSPLKMPSSGSTV